MRVVLSIICVLLAAPSLTRAQMRFTGTGWEGQPMNLQVLPKDIAPRDLVQTMRSFTRALGVRCEHCHVGEGGDLSKFNFESDQTPAKQIARTMLAMVGDINKTVAAVGEPAPAGTMKVSCWTCHRGERTPMAAAPPREGRGRGGVR
jgi:hypothetical protein